VGRRRGLDNAARSPAPEILVKLKNPFLAALASGLVLGTCAQAQTTPAKPAAKAAAKPAAKPPARKPVAPLPVEAPLPKAEGEQLAAAAMTYFGDYACEFDQSVKVDVTPKNDGYVDVHYKAQTWT
jgi:hypothetical protein